MSDAYTVARKHLENALNEATENNIDHDRLGQSMIWEVIALYKASGRNNDDIKSEFEFTLENVGTDRIFHVISFIRT